MKKTATLLLASTCALTFISSSLCMDVEFDNDSNKPRNTSQQVDTSNTISKKNNQTNKLLKTNNILLYTSIMQQKILFEYHDDIQYATHVSVNQTIKNTKLALNNLYTSTNEQLKDKTLHFPMMGETQNNKKESNDII